MLTGPLNLTRFRNGIAYPLVLKHDQKNLDLAGQLIDLFNQSIGERRYDIEESVKAFFVEKVNPKLVQGMARILFSASEFSNYLYIDPLKNRQEVFDASADYWKEKAAFTRNVLKHKQAILSSIEKDEAAALENTNAWLYGDVSDNQTLVSFSTYSREGLVDRFNIEQVQGLLIHARLLELTFSSGKDRSLRQVLQMLKFFQLMFAVREADDDSVTLAIDGPSSILESGRSYGIEMANFFPAILLLKTPWTLQATLKVPGRHRLFRLEIEHDNPYRSFYREKGVWRHGKIVDLIERFNSKYSHEYKASGENRIFPLRDNRYLIPDLVIRSVEQADKKMFIEWLQYISDSKIKWLTEVTPELPAGYVFALKGSRTRYAQLAKKMGQHLLLYTKEITAPSIKTHFQKMLPD